MLPPMFADYGKVPVDWVGLVLSKEVNELAILLKL